MRVKNNVNFNIARTKMKAAIASYGNTAAKKLEVEAKRNAPWENRTSNARNSIQGNFGWEGLDAVISLSGNVDYFVYLELANAKKHAILKPTINQFSADILRGYQRIVK